MTANEVRKAAETLRARSLKERTFCPKCGKATYEVEVSVDVQADLEEIGFDGTCCFKWSFQG